MEQAAARTQVGRTPESRARWLLGFSQLNLAEQVERTLGLELAAFITPTKPARPMDEPDIAAWHKQARQIIDALAVGKPWGYRFTSTTKLEIGAGGALLSTEAASKRKRDEPARVIAEVLSAVGERLRRCPGPRCDSLFVAFGKQRFCAKRCSDLHRTWKRRGKLIGDA